MGRRRQFDHDQVLALYAKGHTPREIADRLGCHPDYASKIVREAGKSRRPGRPKRVTVCLDCGSQNTRSEIV